MENIGLMRLQGRRFSIPEAARPLSPVGDNGTHRLLFELPEQMDEVQLTDCTPALLLQRADGTAYTRPLSAQDGAQAGRFRVSYLLQRADTAVSGPLQFQLRFTKPVGDTDEVVWQSFTDYFIIEPSVDAEAEGEDILPTVFDEAKTACLAAVADAQEIKDSIVPPAIGLDGNWVVNGQSTGSPSRGEKGETGDAGEQGPKGDKGDTGATGPQGPQGQTGETGPIGPQGEQGMQGPQGPTGATGPKGETGEQGPKGDKGDTGAGLTLSGNYDSMEALISEHPTGSLGEAYLVAGDLVVWDGTAWQNMGSIQGPQGPKGDMGETGPQGLQGETGAQGPQGEPTVVNGKTGAAITLTAADVDAASTTDFAALQDTVTKIQGLTFGNLQFLYKKIFLEYVSPTELAFTIDYPEDSRIVGTTVGLITLCPINATEYAKVSMITMQTTPFLALARAFGSGFVADDVVMAACLIIIQYK